MMDDQSVTPTPWFRRDSNGNMALPVEAEVSDFTVGQLADLAVSREALGTFDFAIPQTWVDHVRLILGVTPTWVVWSYPAKSIWGMPFALTEEAMRLIIRYEEATRGW